MSKPRVCIIGAGVAGLCALRHSLDHDMEATAYEQSEVIGGTWVYSEDVKSGPLGDEVHSSMYEDLRTNLPKEVMGFPDFLYPDTIKESFISSNDVLKFLNSYADHFQLRQHIKFSNMVLRVRPRAMEGGNGREQWEVVSMDVKTKEEQTLFYDFVFVCNGHYTKPLYPEIEGASEFRGRTLHSHYYRKSKDYKDEKVLIIGASASGVDIALQIHKAAKYVYLSHHAEAKPDTSHMPNVIQKPDVLRFTENGAIFKDGSTETFDTVIFCTGYNTTFTFLSTDCGLHVEDNYVFPLWKHCININNPSMAVIGILFYTCPTQVFDLQVRFILKYWSKQKQLPSKAEMQAETDKDMQARWEKGLKKRQAHMLGNVQFDYYRDLAETAGLKKIKPVVEDIIRECSMKYITELSTYRNNYFRIIDDEKFVKLPLGAN